ncbi:aminoglycoside phosphotransferase family protein [Pedobacter gandavensis]|uniref:aminoglycoside phosphotransferase family protein n=1 Tax=Pedobacter gandavensis TaxID=2679963 RepID=UPI00292D9B95|nr:aminoglycoside phosphotransferase family protein [Pedobacter gandavensis]
MNKEIAFAKMQLKECQQMTDGVAFATDSSVLQAVLYQDIPAMLKIPMAEEERRGSKLMVHWAGNGAVKVLQHSESALLMERAPGESTLAKMVLEGSTSFF